MEREFRAFAGTSFPCQTVPRSSTIICPGWVGAADASKAATGWYLRSGNPARELEERESLPRTDSRHEKDNGGGDYECHEDR